MPENQAKVQRTSIESDTPAAFTNVKSEADDFQISKPKGAERLTLLSADLDSEAVGALFDGNNQEDSLKISKGMSPERVDGRNTWFDRSGSHRKQLATSLRRNKGVLGLVDMAKQAIPILNRSVSNRI